MALVTCPDCGRAVSDQAPACPGCGRPAAPTAASPAETKAVEPLDPLRTHVGGWLVRKIAEAAKRRPAVAIAAVIACALIGFTLMSRPSSADRDRLRQEAEAQYKAGAELHGQHVRENEQVRAAALKETAARQAAGSEKIRTQSAPLTRPQRAEWMRTCFTTGTCEQWKIDAMIAGAPEADRLHAERASYAASAEYIAREGGKDGPTISLAPAGTISGIVAKPKMGLAMLDLVVPTTLADAKKDPNASRGKRIKVGGTIIEIRAGDDVTQGALMTEGATIVRFVTSMSTKGVYDGVWASFSGVFVQEYDYPNVSGGETRSYLIVGAFEIQENR